METSTPGRVPPQATSVEQIVLGACLLEADAIWSVSAILSPDDFYTARHGQIFGAIVALNKTGTPADLVTVADELKKADQLEYVGGSYYLSELTSVVDTAANAEHYARIVLEKSILRRLITTTTEIATAAYQPDADAFASMDEAEESILRIRDDREGGERSSKIPIKNTLGWLEDIHGAEGGVTGIRTGIYKLDQMTSGWQPADLIIVAGRPGMGKTAFALHMARAAAKSGDGVAVFSLEMSARQLTLRLFSATARIDSQRARTGRMDDDEWVRLARAASQLSELPFFIDDTPAITPMQLRAKTRRLVREHGVKIIIVDYLQLMLVTKDKPNREQEISEISRSLKALAKELDITVVALSQLSRAVESRSDKRPMLSDLRESGAIEQDADTVIFLYRPEYYGIHVDENGNSTQGIAEIIVGKQRQGPVGECLAMFGDKYGTFDALTTMNAPSGNVPQDYTSAPPREDAAPF